MKNVGVLVLSSETRSEYLALWQREIDQEDLSLTSLSI
jgi:hypothetical protein